MVRVVLGATKRLLDSTADVAATAPVEPVIVTLLLEPNVALAAVTDPDVVEMLPVDVEMLPDDVEIFPDDDKAPPAVNGPVVLTLELAMVTAPLPLVLVIARLANPAGS